MSLNDLKVLVTGGAGMVGSSLITRLLTEGAIIRATWHNQFPVLKDDRVSYLQADLTNKEQCQKAVEGMDVVFHCAANRFGAAVMASSPTGPLTSNVMMNMMMLEAAYEAKVKKFLWLGSITGYPPSGNRPLTEEDMFKGEPYDKYFIIAWALRYTEILCQTYGQKLSRQMTTIVLRVSNIYGPNDNFDLSTSNVIPALIRKSVERLDPFEVWGTGDDVRDVIYVDDVVDAMIMSIDKLNSYTVLNIGLGKGHNIKQILQTILELDGYNDARIIFNTSKPSMIPVRLVNTTKAEKVLGYKAKTSLREGLRKTIDWYRKS